MRPSILQETIIVPSRLKPAAITGSECAESVFIHLPMKKNEDGFNRGESVRTSGYIPQFNTLVVAPGDNQVR